MTNEQPQPDYYDGLDDQYSIDEKRDSELTRWQLACDDLIIDLEHDLRSEYYDTKVDDWKTIEGSKPLLNEKGIKAVISLIRSIVNKVLFLSNLRDEDIILIIREIDLDLAQLLFNFHEEYKVKKEHLSMIHDKAIFLIFVGLKRALGEGERQFLTKTERRIERVISTPEQKKSWLPFR